MQIMRCEHLSKIYGGGEGQVYALNDVTLSLESGSFTAITGPNGSGKSTLLHMLSGLDKPTKGWLNTMLNTSKALEHIML